MTILGKELDEQTREWAKGVTDRAIAAMTPEDVLLAAAGQPSERLIVAAMVGLTETGTLTEEAVIEGVLAHIPNALYLPQETKRLLSLGFVAGYLEGRKVADERATPSDETDNRPPVPQWVKDRVRALGLDPDEMVYAEVDLETGEVREGRL